MQNWDHVQAVFDNLHLQPKKSHDVDFSRVRRWVLNGHSKYYRQTLIFSAIPAPQINGLFNKHCFNYEGKVQVKTINQIGTICQIGFQLAQVYHRIQCDSPADMPKARFDFFVEKVRSLRSFGFDF
jgi:U3 small nucleolar RNA-associated protein 25